jgi:autotransporter strand-loop-strand O-heptosyltransferase
MKVININPGLLPIPPNGWGAVEKIIWDYHQEMLNLGIRSEIKYTDEVKYDDSMVVHVHVANLANMLYDRGIPYIFTIHDHHAYLYGKNSPVFAENLKAIDNSVISLSPCKYLVPYFGSKKLKYFSHAVNTNTFKFNNRQRHHVPRLLCVANNGYAYDQSIDRKGFKIAIEAAMKLGLPLTIAGPKNNNNFFKTLPPELSNYVNLTKLYDLDEKWLINLYNEHDIFLHFSELEAGHPNLTLLEAMACGLPIVGTFEEDRYDGMCVVKRDLDQAVDGINRVINDYSSYQSTAINNANKHSYKNQVLELAKIYSEYREKIFGNNIIVHYTDTKLVHKDPKNSVYITFSNGPKVEILGPIKKKYKVKFIDTESGNAVYEGDIGNNMWTVANTKYFVKWKIELYEAVGENWVNLVESHELNLKNKKVKIVLDTQSLGDLMAYIGSVDAFQKKHECDLTCVVYHDELLKTFSKSYTNITFSRYNGGNDEFYAVYGVGYFDQNNWQGNAPVDPKTTSLALVAEGILGLPLTEIKPKLKFASVSEKPKQKYVCIGTHSTAQSKYWNNPDGWKKVVEYIKSKGYEVWDIDRHHSFGNTSYAMNHIPEGVVDKTGDFTLEQRMAQLEHAEFFIGLGSGLSWLAWAVGKPVVLVSGFSMEFAEFNTPYRVINKNVCHGCWNDTSCTFDKGDWKWCPRNKDFECTKQIYAEDVIKMIDKIV